LLVVAVAFAVFATVVPWAVQHSGARLVTITSGSMVPHFPVGSTITIHPVVDATALVPGQIITFHAMGNGVVISHRIVKRIVNPGVSGVFYQTKGDANRTADPDLAPAGNVIGVADDVLPAWQGFAVSLQTPRGRLAVYGSLFLIVALGELVDLVGGTRRRWPADDPDSTPADGAQT
jgi:signal peptidase